MYQIGPTVLIKFIYFRLSGDVDNVYVVMKTGSSRHKIFTYSSCLHLGKASRSSLGHLPNEKPDRDTHTCGLGVSSCCIQEWNRKANTSFCIPAPTLPWTSLLGIAMWRILRRKLTSSGMNLWDTETYCRQRKQTNSPLTTSCRVVTGH